VSREGDWDFSEKTHNSEEEEDQLEFGGGRNHRRKKNPCLQGFLSFREEKNIGVYVRGKCPEGNACISWKFLMPYGGERKKAVRLAQRMGLGQGKGEVIRQVLPTVSV